MKKRTFNGTGREVSEVGLGCWQLGGSDWGEVDDRTAFATLERAVEEGVTFLDTADVYGAGRRETLIGEFLQDHRGGRERFVATKPGRGGGLYPDRYTEAGGRAATEASLRRLSVEALDLTQLHWVPEPVLRQGEIFAWLRRLKDEGKIKGFGASVETDHEAVTVIIPGASRPDQAAQDAGVSPLTPLEAARHEKLAGCYREHVAAHIRGRS